MRNGWYGERCRLRLAAVGEDRERIGDSNWVALAQRPELQQWPLGDLAEKISLKRFAAVVEADDRVPGQRGADQTLFGFLGVRRDRYRGGLLARGDR